MTYRVVGLFPEPFRHLYGLSEEALAAVGVKRNVAKTKPGFPDRIEMRDGEIGATFLLLNHVCMPAETPYRTTHAMLTARKGLADFAPD